LIRIVPKDGDAVELIQHVSQISFLAVKVPKLNPDEPKRPFGFEQGVNGCGQPNPTAEPTTPYPAGLITKQAKPSAANLTVVADAVAP
jgi:hypothetical protein